MRKYGPETGQGAHGMAAVEQPGDEETGPDEQVGVLLLAVIAHQGEGADTHRQHRRYALQEGVRLIGCLPCQVPLTGKYAAARTVNVAA